jgi:hypothetical protein
MYRTPRRKERVFAMSVIGPIKSATAASPAMAVLRAVIIVLALVGAAVALLVYGGRLNRQENDRRLSERRSRNFAAIKENPAEEILIDDAELLAMVVADAEVAENATSLVFTSVDFADERFAEVNKLDRLKNVGIYSSRNAEACLAFLQGMKSIERMWIETSPLADEGIALLATLPNLKQIRFEQVMSVKQIELLEKILPDVNVATPFREDDEPR